MLFTYLPALAAVMGFSALGFWLKSSIVFMITSGLSIMTGLYSPRAFNALGSSFGVGIGLMLILYAFVCIALAYTYLFSKFNKKDDGSSSQD